MRASKSSTTTILLRCAVSHILGSVDSQNLKKTLMKAAVHYHPDKIPSPEALPEMASPSQIEARAAALKWKFLCTEIAKWINAKYGVVYGCAH